MMFNMTMLLMFVSGFLGYVVGRMSHYWLNPLLNNPAWAPHHWIYGVLLLVAGLYLMGLYGLLIAAFGLGLFISDLKDFMHGEFIGPDDDTQPPKFWGID